MTRKALACSAAGAAVVAGVVLAVPAWRAAVGGWLRGEPFYDGEPASRWAGRLGDANSVAHEEAATALDEMGEGAWLLALRDRNSRLAAAEEFLRRGQDWEGQRPATREAVHVLYDALAHADPGTRLRAARAIRRVTPSMYQGIGDLDPFIPVLDAALADDTRGVRWVAVEALADLYPLAPQVGPPLRRALDHPDAYVRTTAALALVRTQDPPEKPLVHVLGVATARAEDGMRQGNLWAAAPVAAFAAVVEPLCRAAQDSEVPTRREAVAALRGYFFFVGHWRPQRDFPNGRIGTGGEARSAVPVLAKALHDPDAEVRRTAVEALGWVGPQAAPAVGELVGLVHGPDRELRRLALDSLGIIGTGAKAACPDLVDLARPTAGNADLRAPAIRALGGLGPEGAAGIPLLRAACHDPDPVVRREAVTALGRVTRRNDSSADPLLRTAFEDPDRGVRVRAALAWLDLKPMSLIEIPAAALAEAVVDADPWARVEAARQLESRGRAGERVRAVLVKGLKDTGGFARAQLALTLWRVARDPAAVAALVELLKDENPSVQAEAAFCLGEIGPDAKDALPTLRRLAGERDAVGRAAAQRAVRQIEGGDANGPR